VDRLEFRGELEQWVLQLRRGVERWLGRGTQNRLRNADRSAAQRQLQRARPVTGRANNVYADRSGAVARRVDNGWESRRDRAWKSEPRLNEQRSPQTRERLGQQSRQRFERPTRQSRPQFNRNEMNRAYQARQRGMSREMALRGPRGGGRMRRH
jgi:hypothetical protein